MDISINYLAVFFLFAILRYIFYCNIIILFNLNKQCFLQMDLIIFVLVQMSIWPHIFYYIMYLLSKYRFN